MIILDKYNISIIIKINYSLYSEITITKYVPIINFLSYIVLAFLIRLKNQHKNLTEWENLNANISNMYLTSEERNELNSLESEHQTKKQFQKIIIFT